MSRQGIEPLVDRGAHIDLHQEVTPLRSRGRGHRSAGDRQRGVFESG
jgi:hypothetical protein